MSFSELTDLNQTLPLDNFNNWIYCVCVVTFDLELGQAMESIYPSHIKLSDTEKSNINYLAFPDSNSGCMGDTRYHFRFRCKMMSKIQNNVDKLSTSYPEYLKHSGSHCYGYVNFRQVKDKSIRRGYYQKSVVVITHLPLPSLFYKIVELLSQSYYTDGDIGLEIVCRDIDRWVPPVAGHWLHLPIRGIVIQTLIPLKADSLAHGGGRVKITKALIENIENEGKKLRANNESICLIPNPHSQDCFSVLGSVLHQLQMLWELVLTNQPLLVISSSPSSTSMAVQAIISSIWPLQFSQEFRPFFTIQDSEFREFTRPSQTPPRAVIGITNPFFTKTLSKWPHALAVAAPGSTPTRRRAPRNPGLLAVRDELKAGLYSAYRPFLQTDKSLIKSLDKGIEIERPDQIQSEIIRKFYLELTQSFIIPLESYVASLMPLKRQIVPFKTPPSLKSFNLDEFLKSLETCGPQLTTGIKGDWIGLYRSFYSSPNFVSWLSQRQQEINVKLVQIHTEVVCRVDLSQWLVNKPEVELVDLIIQINNKLRDCHQRNIPISEEHERRLRDQIKVVMASLAPDLQQMLLQPSSRVTSP